MKTNGTQQHIFSGKVNTACGKLNIKFKEYFEWNITVNNEKGTAGGNMKLNLPARSSFSLGIIFISLSAVCAFTGITAYLVPAILLYFSVCHFSKWGKATAAKLSEHMVDLKENISLHRVH